MNKLFGSVVSVLVLALVFVSPACSKKKSGEEHAGTPAAESTEEGGDTAVHKDMMQNEKEHAGEEMKDEKEHAGEEMENEDTNEGADEEQEHPGDESKVYTADQIKTAMTTHIENQTKEHAGLFLINDPKENNKLLQLQFVKIHDPVRVIEGKGYFACTDFEVAGEAGKLYDLDFWLNSKNGVLEVTDTKIHKEPLADAGKWVKHARYTFVNDNPITVQ